MTDQLDNEPEAKPDEEHEVEPVAEHWPCYECGRFFDSHHSWSTHSRACIGHISPTWRAIWATHCVSCMQEFHTVPRLQQHLRHTSPRCMELAAANLPPPPPELRRALLQVRSAQRLPAIRLAGPLPAWA